MSRNGRERERESQDDLRRQAEERREAIKQTAQALEGRLRERTGQIADAFDRTKDQLDGIDQLIHKHRYWFVGGAIGIGLALARGSSRRGSVARAPQADIGPRYILVERNRPGLLRSLAGGAAALALRQGLQWMATRFEGVPEDDEPLMLPPGRRRGD